MDNQLSCHVPENSARQFRLFSFLFAIGVLFHQSILSDWHPCSHHIAVSLASILVAFNPGSFSLFLLLTVVHFASFLIDMPYVVNHWLFVGLIDIGVLLCAARLAVRQRTLRLSPGTFYRELGPVIRWSVVLMYLFAAVAKLNSAFFNPELSAAVSLYGTLSDKFGGVLPRTQLAHWGVIWVTALLECSLPLLLVIRPTRIYAVLLALGFHLVMGMAGFIPFSGFAVAFLFLFVPERFVNQFWEWNVTHRWWNRVDYPSMHWSMALLACGLWVAVAAARTYAWLPPDSVRMGVIRIGQAVFAIYYLTAIVLLTRLAWLRSVVPEHAETPSPTEIPLPFRVAHPLYFFLPLVLILNGLSPYLGLKTESSFTMYSNLQTEESQWNHLLVPKGLRVFSWQDRLVRVIESDHPPFVRSADEDIRWVWFEFQREASRAAGRRIVFEYDGRITEIADPATDPILSQPPAWWMSKIFWFREVPRPENNTIRH